MKTCIAAIASLLFVCIIASSAPDTVRGKEAFDKRCAGSHGLDQTKEGPKPRHIYGQRSGATPGFRYSDELKKAHLIWDESALDKWLQDPEKLVPDNDMSTRVPDAADRANIIAYLRSLNSPSDSSRSSQR
jgi:cytochrome c